MKHSMMKRGFLALALAMVLVLTFSLSAQAAAKEGEDYMVLAKPIPNMDKTVIKVFSYDCPFCYKYDKSVTPEVVKIIQKDGIKYTVWHLKTKGKYGPQASELFAALITKDEKAKVGLFDDKSSFKKAKMAYYNAYHDKKERWGDGKDPAAFMKTGLDAAGISDAEFQKLLKEPATQARLKQWEGAREIAGIQGVPAFVVKGKYLIYTKSIKSINGMAATIKELMAK
ncbi:MAG TPA: thiol:disulfide interchange protein DsbA/DsbL [Syntrophales bacterium]|nr:thiol:disulfide interchange protein DsbA/DsbL [Syntrophales bacterium]HOX94445.1 thiol:disulfide interchange protein DsbA/DsbL [Syntrophales bacterium]HPI56612.1 thiol:disulfide interchange protein DsbA/DsbL [Syntrophales bacterium]HPN24962.1 thiol:disulfide interchange protein DsbA/DsbL [Syntrophales bacterium]HQM29772.1 thiol:disulfide interchange protein DsbA/DsbL [Syntrophales bacterium]